MAKIKDFFRYDSWLLLLDILAVNGAYCLALVIRFYGDILDNDRLVYYLGCFIRIVPFYTVAAIVVFVLFKLYGGMWVYAGINDMNRIIMANIVTSVIQVALSFIIVGRMPISYFLVGGLLQFLLVAAFRFGNRFISMEKGKIAKSKEDAIPALVVGSGDYGRKVIRHLDQNTPFRPVVIAGAAIGRIMDGIPVVSLGDIQEQIKSKGIRVVFIADDTLTKEQREAIDQAAENLEVKDYTGYLSNLSGSMPVSSLLEIAKGPVTLVVDGQEMKYNTAGEALRTMTQRYEVKSITTPRIELEKGETDESWIKEFKDNTGEDVSFF